MEEEWRDIKGYEDYQISNKGNVKSLNFRHTGQERILKKMKQKNGYLQVRLYKDGKMKSFLVHRLVAETFLPNPDNKPCVNHLSERKTENNVENLEWVSYQYNINYGTAIERIQEKLGTKIKCFDLETKEETIYPSLHEAARQMNIPYGSIRDNMTICKRPYKNKYKFSEL